MAPSGKKGIIKESADRPCSWMSQQRLVQRQLEDGIT